MQLHPTITLHQAYCGCRSRLLRRIVLSSSNLVVGSGRGPLNLPTLSGLNVVRPLPDLLSFTILDLTHTSNDCRFQCSYTCMYLTSILFLACNEDYSNIPMSIARVHWLGLIYVHPLQSSHIINTMPSKEFTPPFGLVV